MLEMTLNDVYECGDCNVTILNRIRTLNVN